MELHPYIVSAQSVMDSLGRQSGLWWSKYHSFFKEFQISVRKVKYYSQVCAPVRSGYHLGSQELKPQTYEASGVVALP